MEALKGFRPKSIHQGRCAYLSLDNLYLLIELKLHGQALPVLNAMTLFPLASKEGGTQTGTHKVP